MEKRFELPYNFDKQLLLFYQKHSSKINYLYLPPYREDLSNTRTSIQTDKIGQCYMPTSRREYEDHLKFINDCDLRFVVLWQLPNSIISVELLDYYSSLGCIGFIVGNDDNAKIIKEYDSDLLVIASLVQRLRSHLLNRDFTYYDQIVLYYTFNRSLESLKHLKYLQSKIILMPNTLCNIECPSYHHWFPSNNDYSHSRIECWTKFDTLSKCGVIFPEHLFLFDDYVGGYKLQGREYPTEAIKFLCHFYFNRVHYRDFVRPFLNDKMAEELYRLSHSVPPEIYYNLYSDQVNSRL